MDHVLVVLRIIDELSDELPAGPDAGDDHTWPGGYDDLTLVRLGAWFHDAIYRPGRGDNEMRSAYVARDSLEVAGAAPVIAAEVSRLVILTATHAPAPDDRRGAVLCDADLAILGSDPSDYDVYVHHVRQEFPFVPDDTFAQRRAAVLQRLLDRPFLYSTTAGRERFEQQARSNVATEIERLTESFVARDLAEVSDPEAP
jgi:predicted metal-dependent HD superfamily phosphohydrolase